MGLRKKNYRDSMKYPIFRGRLTKNHYRFKMRLNEKEGLIFLKGDWYPNAHYETWCLVAQKTHIKVPRPDMCGSMISLSKIADQMWRKHILNQKSKTTEWAVGNDVGGNRDWRVRQNLNRWGRQYRGGFYKIGRAKTLLPTMWDSICYLKFSRSNKYVIGQKNDLFLVVEFSLLNLNKSSTYLVIFFLPYLKPLQANPLFLQPLKILETNGF